MCFCVALDFRSIMGKEVLSHSASKRTEAFCFLLALDFWKLWGKKSLAKNTSFPIVYSAVMIMPWPWVFVFSSLKIQSTDLDRHHCTTVCNIVTAFVVSSWKIVCGFMCTKLNANCFLDRCEFNFSFDCVNFTSLVQVITYLEVRC